MKVNFNNICYPKPLVSNLTDDFIEKEFSIEILEQQYEKSNQKLNLSIKTNINNPFIIELIKEEKVYIILHIEQKTQREVSVLKLNDVTNKTINLYQYSTTEPIEIIGILYCKENITINNKYLNNIYSLLKTDIEYERGDILGYSNEININLPEDKRIGSIFNLIKDTEDVLKGQPLKVMFNSTSDLLQILINKEIHEKYIKIYKKDQYAKRLMFLCVVEPAVVSAYTEMFLSYEIYQEKKWCRTLAIKVEQKLKIPADEIFKKDNYDVNKVYEFTNYALGNLFKDSVNIYESGLEG